MKKRDEGKRKREQTNVTDSVGFLCVWVETSVPFLYNCILTVA